MKRILLQASVLFTILVIAFVFSSAVMDVIMIETELNVGDGIYVIGGTVFLIASVVPIAIIILIRKWASK